MYAPAHFASQDLAILDALFARDAFVTLISSDANGLPFASHLPVVYRRHEQQIQIRGHWARANPQSGHTGSALLIVHGPHGYISPTWYADPDHQVPTWNYAVAHLRGQLRQIDDEADKQSLVAELAAVYESGENRWRFPQSAPSKLKSLRGIIGFEFELNAMAIKCKFNQNHPEANIRGAIAGLRERGTQDQELAAWMDWANFGTAL